VVLLVQLRRLGGVMFGVLLMAVRGLRVMRGLLEISGVMVLCRFAMMPRSVVMVIRRLAVMFAHFLHLNFSWLTVFESDLVSGECVIGERLAFTHSRRDAAPARFTSLPPGLGPLDVDAARAPRLPQCEVVRLGRGAAVQCHSVARLKFAQSMLYVHCASGLKFEICRLRRIVDNRATVA
jgi:hypothetical protein